MATWADLNLVAASWFASWRKGGSCPDVTPTVYKAGIGPVIDSLIRECEVRVVFATAAPEEVCGWACWSPATERLHYVYVKKTYRRMGIASGLLRSLPVLPQYTFRTRDWTASGLAGSMEFNPFALWR